MKSIFKTTYWIKIAATIIIITLFCSCNKGKKMVFRGQVIYQLNNKPLKNCDVMLIHAYDIGHAESNFYGPYKTDANGNFGFTEDIKRYHVEKFGYRITNPEIHPNLSTETEAYSNGDFQTINFLSYAGINFHIKNTTPLNGADLFVSYTTAFDTNSNQETIYKNFSGINVDVSQYVYPFGTHNSLLYYKYQYRKANVYYTTPFDTIRLIGEDTVVANIFY